MNLLQNNLRSGLLTGRMTKERVANFPEDDFRKRAKNYQEPLLSRNLAWAEFLKTLGVRHGVFRFSDAEYIEISAYIASHHRLLGEVSSDKSRARFGVG